MSADVYRTMTTEEKVEAIRKETEDKQKPEEGGWREQKAFITEVIVCILSLC